MSSDTSFRDRIRCSLADLRRRKLTAGYKREAAVLMLIFERAGEPHILLTRRTEEVQTHKGQISFPGGMRLERESLETTALRETFEEVGIEANLIEVLGRFHDYISSTEYLVAPFAGYIAEPFARTAQAREVAEILDVPLKLFSDPGKLRIEKMLRQGQLVDVYFYSYGTYEIWGLTARIIKEFLEQLYQAG